MGRAETDGSLLVRDGTGCASEQPAWRLVYELRSSGSLRQERSLGDGECVRCHTTSKRSGFTILSAIRIALRGTVQSAATITMSDLARNNAKDALTHSTWILRATLLRNVNRLAGAILLIERKVRRRYKQHPVDDQGWTDWIRPATGYRMRCCDCGLVHEMEFRTEGGAVEFRARRDARATAGKRREYHDG